MKKIRRFDYTFGLITIMAAAVFFGGNIAVDIIDGFHLEFILWCLGIFIIIVVLVLIIILLNSMSFDEVGIHFFFSKKETKLIKWDDIEKVAVCEQYALDGRETYTIQYYNKNKKIRSVRFSVTLETSKEIIKYYNKEVFRY